MMQTRAELHAEINRLRTAVKLFLQVTPACGRCLDGPSWVHSMSCERYHEAFALCRREIGELSTTQRAEAERVDP